MFQGMYRWGGRSDGGRMYKERLWLVGTIDELGVLVHWAKEWQPAVKIRGAMVAVDEEVSRRSAGGEAQ